MYRWYILIFVSILFSIADSGFFKKNERVWATLEQIKSCFSGEDNRLKLHLYAHKYNRTHTGVNMNLTAYEDIGSQYTIDIELRMWGDGGWKRNFFRYSKADGCNTLHLILGKTWDGILQAAGATLGCPVKTGYYEFFDFFVDLSKLPILTSPGKYMLHAKFTKRRIPQACVQIVLNVQAELFK